jgi:glyoxylate/hydroxypyruvate reductase
VSFLQNGGMRILFCANGTKAAPWVDALRLALPDASVDDWQPGAPQADYAVVWSPPQQFLAEQPRLKGIFNIGAGVDALMKLALPPEAIVVRIDDGGMAVQMAEFVCHALIRHFRELDGYEQDIAQGKWSYRKPRSRAEFPVGIMGLGVLGQRVAQAVRHFEFPVLGWSRTAKSLPGARCFCGEAQFDGFLAATRVLVCLLPLTPETENIMNARSLSRLMPGGYVINVARGGHLVEEDLLALLDSGHLAGAALDVFRTEPLPPGHPFLGHPKISVTPHTSARTLREETIVQIAGKILAFERGEPIAGVVDRQRGY